MAQIPQYLNIGDRDDLTLERLLVIIEEMYIDIAEALNKKPDVYVRTTVGQVTDTALATGSINIKDDPPNPIIVEILTSHPTPQTVTWQVI